jgi:hypothetical protein
MKQKITQSHFVGKTDNYVQLVKGYFSRRHHDQIHSGVHLILYLTVTGNFFAGVKQQKRESIYSPTSSAEVKNTHSHTPFPVRLYGVVLKYVRDMFSWGGIFVKWRENFTMQVQQCTVWVCCTFFAC